MKQRTSRIALCLMCMLTFGWVCLPINAIAQNAEAPPVATRQLTPHGLKAYMEQALIQEGVADMLKVTLIGSYPDMLYSHESSFVPKIAFARIDRAAAQFLAEVRLVTADDAALPLGKPFEVKGRYEAWKRIPVLKDRLSHGDVIKLSDIVMSEVPSRKVKRDTILLQDKLIGKTPRRVISPYRSIEQDELVEPPIVRQNDEVTLVYKRPFMELKASGFALDDGALGETITLRNSDSHEVVRGIVRGKGLVEVSPERLDRK